MASFADQLANAKAASQSANVLEAKMRAEIQKAFDDWDKGVLTNITVRYQLERIVRSAFRSSAALAAAAVGRAADVPGWKPAEQVFNPDYLKKLLADTQRNLRDYKKTDDAAAKQRAVSNIMLSAGVGVHAGYTAQQMASYKELTASGMQVRKFWSANFVNHEPCVYCRQLHGTEVDLDQEFVNPNPKARVFISLYGPPLHPNCQCFLVFFIVTLDNATTTPSLDVPTPAPGSMSSDKVKSMPLKIFTAVIAALKKVVNLARRKK